MGRRAAGSILLLLLGATCNSGPRLTPDSGGAEREATAAAEAWLELVDAGRYLDSWQQAAPRFKSAATEEAWEQAVESARSPLGALQSRELRTAEFTRSLPGAPDGEYVVLTYDSSFTNKRSAVETVTPMRDADGQWRVSGYYVR